MKKWHRGNVDCLYKVDEEYPTQISVITGIGHFKHLINSIKYLPVLKTVVSIRQPDIFCQRLSCMNQILSLTYNSKTCLCTKRNIHYKHRVKLYNYEKKPNSLLIIYVLARYKKCNQ